MFLGIDVGTTGVKALLLDGDGQAHGYGYQVYPTFSDGLCSEQHAADWYDSAVSAVRAALQGLDPSAVEALSFSSQGGTLTLLDEQGRELRPAMTWMDGRASEEARELEAFFGAKDFYEIFGSRCNNALDAAKLLWLKRHEPETFSRAAVYAGVMEYMLLRFTGRCVSDVTNGAMRQLVDTRHGVYDRRMLTCLGITENKLPPLLPTGAPVGGLNAAAAADLGLAPGTPVFNGAHDQYCSALGNGLCAGGDLLVATGTTWVLFCVGDRLMRTEPKLVSAPYPIDGLYGAFASLANGGSSLRWLSQLTGQGYDTLNACLAERDLKRNDLFFRPYMANGSGFPSADPNARGSFSGLTLSSDAADLAAAVMEGVAFETRRAAEAIRRAGVPTDRVIMCGGATKSPIWLRILAAVLETDLFVPAIRDSACVGAAILAAAGTTGRSVRERCLSMVSSGLTVPCEEELAAHYREKYRRYLALSI
ncbi:MAG: hypothetical protein KIG36_06790 [Eubacteriales bacterium]|nr:hypothetical protein [Eubacteriales bacterium]